MKCVSLFSCAGFGDLGLDAAGLHTIVANELLKERAELLQKNFPSTRVIVGDIHHVKDDIVSCAREILNGEQLHTVIVSAPCQGQSSNGMGRIRRQIQRGHRPADDPRNRLILPAIEVIQSLRPKCIIIENVAAMRYTQIVNEFDEYETILSILYRQLPEYVLRSAVLNAADYGVPQTRKRLITIGILSSLTEEPRLPDYCSEDLSVFHPLRSHPTHVTLTDCIGHLPELDAMHKLQDEDDAFHRIPKWNDAQYFCMQYTPENHTAFDNTRCVHCGAHTFDMSVVHCSSCSAFLPRPRTKKHDDWRLVKAFKTAYRRMSWDRPGNALTTNSGVISSDVKGHPSQHRVLSLREIMIVASISGYPGCEQAFTYSFGDDDKLIREVIGECIPPLLSYKIAKHVQTLV